MAPGGYKSDIRAKEKKGAPAISPVRQSYPKNLHFTSDFTMKPYPIGHACPKNNTIINLNHYENHS